MNAIVVIGGGRDLTSSITRRFSSPDAEVVFVCSPHEQTEGLVDHLRGGGLTFREIATDIQDPASVVAVLEDLASDFGHLEVVVFASPLGREFMRPVLATNRKDLRNPFETGVLVPTAVIQHVLRGMRSLGRGSLLFVSGEPAYSPNGEVAAASIALAGQSALVKMWHTALSAENIQVGQVVTSAAIVPGSPGPDAALVADCLWHLHVQRDDLQVLLGDDPDVH